MSLFKKILFFSFFYFILIINANSENKVAYVDLDFLITNTKIGKTLFEKLKNNENKKFKEFSIEEKNLKEQEKKILSSKNIISEKQLNIDIEKFQKKLQAYKNSKSTEIEKLKNTRNDEILKLLNSINPLIQKYMNDNSIDILIDKKNIYIANKKYEITNNLILLVDQNYK